MRLILLSILVVLFSNACTLQKRHYRNGYTIKLNVDKHNKTKINHQNDDVNNSSHGLIKANEPQQASVSNELTLNASDRPIINLNHKQINCDTIKFKDGTIKPTIITEISDNQIKFYACENPDGPIYIVEKESIDKVIFKNGTVETYENKQNGKSNSTKKTINTNHKLEDSTLQITGLLSSVFGILGIACVAIGLYLSLFYLFIIAFCIGLMGLFLGLNSSREIKKQKKNTINQALTISGITLNLVVVAGLLISAIIILIFLLILFLLLI